MALKVWKPDPKPPKKEKKPKSRLRRTKFPKTVSSIKRVENVKQATQDDAFYQICAVQFPRVCAYCKNPIWGNFTRANFDHVFPKSQFPHLRYVIEDIAPTCWDCHQIKTSGKYTERMKDVFMATAKKLISMGLLEQIGEPDCNRLKDWVIKPFK